MATRSAPYLLSVVLAAAGACSPVGPQRHSAAGVDDSVPLDTLFAQLRAASPEMRRRAAGALSQPGPRMPERLKALRAALTDTSKQVGFTAAWSLGRLGALSVPTLMEALADSHAVVRFRAVWALGKVGPPAAPARQGIQAAMADPDRSVREVALWAIGQVDPKATSAKRIRDLGSTEDLAAGLAGQDPLERLDAVRRFQPYLADPRSAIPVLVRALGDSDPRMRAAAADALVAFGPSARTALTAALADENPVVRLEASVALVRLRAPY